MKYANLSRNISQRQIYLFSKLMSQFDEIDQILIQPYVSRPMTQANQQRKACLSQSSNNFPQRSNTSNKVEYNTKPSTQVTLNNQHNEYLHIRLMRKNKVKTPQILIDAFQQKIKIQESTQPLFNIRKRKLKAISTARTEQVVPTPKEIRPNMVQTAEKVSYFDDVCSGAQALKAYKVVSHIGKGAFTVVSLAIGREDKKNYAVKTYEKIEALDWGRLACIKRQIKNLRSLQNSRVIRLVEVIKERKKLYLVLQNGGKQSLSGLIRKERVLSPSNCKRLFRQVLQGISYCHQIGVCHRDLKPQNILLDELGNIKIIDFGFSANSRIMLSNYCGTPAYMSPEIVKKQPYIGAKADIWALGVMLYLMMVGHLPFRASHQQELNRLIASGKYRYRQEGSVPEGAKKIIQKMLQVEPNARPSAKQLLEESWLS